MNTPKWYKKIKPSKKRYENEDTLADEFCIKAGCSNETMKGKDFNGEPNCYGCKYLDMFIFKYRRLIK